jgi:hypothetical protein
MGTGDGVAVSREARLGPSTAASEGLRLRLASAAKAKEKLQPGREMRGQRIGRQRGDTGNFGRRYETDGAPLDVDKDRRFSSRPSPVFAEGEGEGVEDGERDGGDDVHQKWEARVALGVQHAKDGQAQGEIVPLCD